MKEVQAAPLRPPRDVNERLINERVWSEAAAADDLDSQAYQEWLGLRSTHRFVACRGKKLILWRCGAGTAKIVKSFVIDEIGLAWAGMLACLQDSSGARVTVGHSPARLAEGVFLWLPYYNDVQFLQGNMLKFSMVCRQRLNPSTKMPGTLFLSESGPFNDLWPGVGA